MPGGLDRAASPDRSALRKDRDQLLIKRRRLVSELTELQHAFERDQRAFQDWLATSDMRARDYRRALTKLHEAELIFPPSSSSAQEDVAEARDRIVWRHLLRCRDELEDVISDLAQERDARDLVFGQTHHDFDDAKEQHTLAVKQIDERIAVLNRMFSGGEALHVGADDDVKAAPGHNRATNRELVMRTLRESSGVMQMKDIVARVQALGSPSGGASIRTLLSKMREDDQLVLVGRGLYALPDDQAARPREA